MGASLLAVAKSIYYTYQPRFLGAYWLIFYNHQLYLPSVYTQIYIDEHLFKKCQFYNY